jgi:hypothetical protein
MLLLIAGIGLGVPTAAAVPPSPVCEDTDNESGFGGTNVYCDYTCPEGTILNIAVVAHDQEFGKATAAAWTDCGGTGAMCDQGTGACDGSSALRDPMTTTFAGLDNCHGRSYESIDSSVTVTCQALGANVDICDLLKDFCDAECLTCEVPDPCQSGRGALCDGDPCPDNPALLTALCAADAGTVIDAVCDFVDDCSVTAVQAACLVMVPGLSALAGPVLDAMFPATQRSVLSMVSAHVENGQGIYVLWDGQNCSGGPF